MKQMIAILWFNTATSRDNCGEVITLGFQGQTPAYYVDSLFSCKYKAVGILLFCPFVSSFLCEYIVIILLLPQQFQPHEPAIANSAVA